MNPNVAGRSNGHTNLRRRGISLWLIQAMVLGLGLWAPITMTWAQRPLPRLTLDTEPLPPELKERTSLAPVVKKAAPSVVTIYTTRTVRGTDWAHPFLDDPWFRRFFGDRFRRERLPREFQARGLGSGVIVSEDGYILTNFHVVEQADEIRVRLADGKTEYQAEVIGADPHTDVAVLKIPGRGLPAMVIADSDQLEVGDLVLALGNPFGVGQTVTMGIVSAVGRGELGLTDYEDFIQTDAPINVGNSGGALVDVRGRLVGINTAIVSGGGGSVGVGFAVPINMARLVMERLLTEGRIRRGYLGIYLRRLTPELSRELDLPETSGALVGGVAPGTPAEAAGLREGDLVLEFNGRTVRDARHLRLMASQSQPGTEATLKVWRNGQVRTVRLTLGELPDSEAVAESVPPPETGPWEDLEWAPLDPQTRREREIPDYIQGVLVLRVPARSPAAQAGLRPGDVLLQVNGRRVRTPEEAQRALEEAAGPEVRLRVWRREGNRSGTQVLVVPTQPRTR
jgi:serine protease Do